MLKRFNSGETGCISGSATFITMNRRGKGYENRRQKYEERYGGRVYSPDLPAAPMQFNEAVVRGLMDKLNKENKRAPAVEQVQNGTGEDAVAPIRQHQAGATQATEEKDIVGASPANRANLPIRPRSAAGSVTSEEMLGPKHQMAWQGRRSGDLEQGEKTYSRGSSGNRSQEQKRGKIILASRLAGQSY